MSPTGLELARLQEVGSLPLSPLAGRGPGGGVFEDAHRLGSRPSPPHPGCAHPLPTSGARVGDQTADPVYSSSIGEPVTSRIGRPSMSTTSASPSIPSAR